MAEKNDIRISKDAELIRFQFTDDTRQTLESVTVFLKDRFAEYGYLPETDVIPIEWLEKWFTEKHKRAIIWWDCAEGVFKAFMEDWRAENADKE